MPILTGYVATGTDDWDQTSNNATTLTAEWVHSLSLNRRAYARISVDLSGGTLTAVTIYWVHHAYRLGRNETYDRYVQASSGDTGGTYDTMFSDTGTPPAGGTWESSARYTSAAKLAYFNTEGGYTGLKFAVNDGTVADRDWEVRSYDYDGFGLQAPKIVFEYEPYVAPTFKKKIYIIT